MQIHAMTATKATDPPAYLTNGVIGLRLGAIPLPRGIAFVNGFVGRLATSALEGYDKAPYPIGADLQVNGVWLSDRQYLVTFQEQRYDFSCGELTTCFTFTVAGVTAHVRMLTFCSRSLPTLALQ